MKQDEKQRHWEFIFRTKDTAKVSWHQAVPATALRLIDDLNIDKSAKIIDIGCGDSFLPDFLLKKGFTDITVLDISSQAIQTLKKRLTEHHSNLTYHTSDVLSFNPDVQYSVWYDRAVFHFLNDESEIKQYTEIVSCAIAPKGFLILATFSTEGPDECSGLPVKQYNEDSLNELLKNRFKKVKCFSENHHTPSGSVQKFLYCVFQKE